MGRSRIEWTDETWNPVTGCTQVSAGCQHCYAERIARRLWRGRPFSDVRTHPNRLDTPLRWRKRRRVFVCSMSDLFHPDVQDDFIDTVFGILLACDVLVPHRGHVFQVLTKRHLRMHQYFTAPARELVERWARSATPYITLHDEDMLFHEHIESLCYCLWDAEGRPTSKATNWGYPQNVFPLRNVWLGITAENQTTANGRVPVLLKTPAAIRFISCEPLLSSIQLRSSWMKKLDWIIVGGESGPGARALYPDWVFSIRDRCVETGTAFFFKQWGGVQKKRYGRKLDGQTWDQFPTTT